MATKEVKNEVERMGGERSAASASQITSDFDPCNPGDARVQQVFCTPFLNSILRLEMELAWSCFCAQVRNEVKFSKKEPDRYHGQHSKRGVQRDEEDSSHVQMQP